VCSVRTSSSLEWLINPVRSEVFFRDDWENQPLVVKRQQPDFFASLLTLDEVDRVLTTLDLRHPNVTPKNADRKVSADDYTVGVTPWMPPRFINCFRKAPPSPWRFWIP
jgi:hypothetical protein